MMMMKIESAVAVSQGISQFYLHMLRFIRKKNEPYLPPLNLTPRLQISCVGSDAWFSIVYKTV